MKVLAMQKRGSKEDYYTGVVIGKQEFMREHMALFNEKPKEYKDTRLLIRMSNGEKVKRWLSEIFIKETKKL